MPLLLDTCAAIWLVEGQGLSKGATEALASAATDSETVLVSPITAWEIGMLSAKGRLRMPLSPHAWFERLLRMPGISLAELSYKVLVDSSFLPGSSPRDPVDRILSATAREWSYCLVTRDRHLLDYAGDGHIQALAC